MSSEITSILFNGKIGIKCNECGKIKWIKDPHKRMGQKLRQAARESGWKVTRKKAVCPKHE